MSVRYWLLLNCLLCFLLCTAVNFFYFPAGLSFGDENRYLASALDLVRQNTFAVGNDRAWEMPGAAAFFALPLAIAGPENGIRLIRILQSILLVMQVLLLASIACHVFKDSRAVVITATLTAIYPFFVYYQGLLLSETSFNTLLIAAIAALYWWREHGARIDGHLLLVSLLLALAGWVKPTLLFLPPVLLFGCAWLWRRDLRHAIRVGAVASVIFVAVFAPWWIRNGLLFDAFVPFTTTSSANLYLGNNAHNSNFGVNWITDVDQAVVARINALPEIARQAAYKHEAVEWIVGHPTAFLRGTVVKLFRYWNVIPNAVEFRSSGMMLISLLSFGPVLVLAMVCVAFGRRHVELAPIYALIGYYTVVHCIVIASLRYRLPLEPFLIVMASYPLAQIVAKFQARFGSSSAATS